MENWTLPAVRELFDMPLMDLLYRAHQVHRAQHDPNAIQMSTLLSIKTGLCPEDCRYCSQSVHYETNLENESLMSVEAVLEKAQIAKASGATRFCMGAAWRNPRGKAFEQVLEIVRAVKALGMEVCVTLGMLTQEQADALKVAGLDYYNHNLDSSPAYYEKVVTTHTYDDRLKTLDCVRQAGLNQCCGGIIGMGESREDRIQLLIQLANLPTYPESVPINQLVKVPGTPFSEAETLDPFEFVRTIAVTRIMMPRTMVRLSAGRAEMSDEMQALCFFAGANSIHYGGKLLTTKSPVIEKDRQLFQRLGLKSLAIC